MATKPNLSEHISLLFELYNRIPQNRVVTAHELLQQLANINIERDIRTIQRNLEILVRYLDVVKDTRDRPYGYRRTPSQLKSFGPREMLLLLLAEEWLVQSFPVEYRSTINSVFSDIHNQKFQQPEARSGQHQPRVHLDTDAVFGNAYSSAFSVIFEQLSIALIETKQLKLTIDNQEHCVEPLGLALLEPTLSLIYRDTRDRQYQHINIESIQNAALSTFTFQYPRNFNLKTYLEGVKTTSGRSLKT
ncbi:helix-turn-helix transcriptional regulator [Photobacterium lutimaris]|uniref:WYL domain-containing protein n=1 Tax=Photobacterium lutimaris TaxID=388278 RepID=A0A2T3II33_9GAMM|nr:hypothetical protein [Photobacterium lutimaris]PSU27970.1 hypothetical protein C9I99_26630 [Photobacterium lutimaris]TDR69968.1 hypothetical protein DFP78_12522 [Photobacterium lutimaris]